MTIIDLKEQIIKKELKHFYIFVGEEIGIMNIYLKEMSHKLNLPISRVPSLGYVYSQLGDNLFGSSSALYVIRGEKDFMNAEDAYDRIDKDLGENYVVLLYDKMDSRLKFSKHFQDRTVTFEKLSTDILVSYIKKTCDLDTRHAELLAALCGNSYDICMLECDKINRYVDSQNVSRILAMDVLVSDGTIYQQEDSNVFKFSEAVMLKKVDEAAHIAELLRADGIDAVTMLGTLYASMKNVLLVQVCEDDDIPKTTGLDGRQVYYAKKYVGRYSDGALLDNVVRVAKTIDGIKTGSIDDTNAVQYILVNLS